MMDRGSWRIECLMPFCVADFRTAAVLQTGHGGEELRAGGVKGQISRGVSYL